MVSDLVRMECLVGPIKAGNAGLEKQSRLFFSASGVQVVTITAAVCDRAAEELPELKQWARIVAAQHNERAAVGAVFAADEADDTDTCSAYLKNDRRVTSKVLLSIWDTQSDAIQAGVDKFGLEPICVLKISRVYLKRFGWLDLGEESSCPGRR